MRPPGLPRHRLTRPCWNSFRDIRPHYPPSRPRVCVCVHRPGRPGARRSFTYTMLSRGPLLAVGNVDAPRCFHCHRRRHCRVTPTPSRRLAPAPIQICQRRRTPCCRYHRCALMMSSLQLCRRRPSSRRDAQLPDSARAPAVACCCAAPTSTTTPPSPPPPPPLSLLCHSAPTPSSRRDANSDSDALPPWLAAAPRRLFYHDRRTTLPLVAAAHSAPTPSSRHADDDADARSPSFVAAAPHRVNNMNSDYDADTDADALLPEQRRLPPCRATPTPTAHQPWQLPCCAADAADTIPPLLPAWLRLPPLPPARRLSRSPAAHSL